MFEPVGFTQYNEFGEQSFLVNYLPIIKPPKLIEDFFLKRNGVNGSQIDTHRKLRYEELISSEQEEEEEDFNLEIAPKVQDYIFLIDRSGSMSGSPIQLAVGALKLFLHSLPLGSKFNVVSFGTDFKKLFPNSVEYNEDNLKIAVS